MLSTVDICAGAVPAANLLGDDMLLSLLADRICKVTFESLPHEAVETAKNGILDTVGVTLAGAQEKTTAVVTRALRKTAAVGPALIFGGNFDRLFPAAG